MNNERKEIATKKEQKSGIGEANSEILFTGLTSNTLYYVELNYDY